jgi:8-oxo-dGTP diphosphatase
MAKEGEEHLVAKIAQKVIIEKDGRALIVRHPQGSDWELPGGRLNKGELPEEGLMREVAEELGAEIIPKGVVQISTFVHQTEGDHLTVVYKAVLKNPDEDFVLEREEVGETKWITALQLDEQPIWVDNRRALEVFFKIGDK